MKGILIEMIKKRLCKECGNPLDSTYKELCRRCYRKTLRNRNPTREKKWMDKNRKEWHEYFAKRYGKMAQCEICKRIIPWNKVHWDHRHGKDKTNLSPSEWFPHRVCSEKNKKLWEKFDYGILCSSCNPGLPSEARGKWLKNAIMYYKESIRSWKEIDILNIQGIEWIIRKYKNVKSIHISGKHWGECNYDKREIKIYAELPENEYRLVLLHEINHALTSYLSSMYEALISNYADKKASLNEITETYIDITTKFLFQVLQDNGLLS